MQRQEQGEGTMREGEGEAGRGWALLTDTFSDCATGLAMVLTCVCVVCV